MQANISFIISLIVLTSICDTISQIILKSAINLLRPQTDGLKKIFIFLFNLVKTPIAWLALVFSILSLFIWLFVLSKADLNFAFSVDSMHYIFIAFASSWILKEKVGPLRWLGTLLIVGGIVLVTLS
jgi:drug/metabolite transporter (DMT)-like permease